MTPSRFRGSMVAIAAAVALAACSSAVRAPAAASPGPAAGGANEQTYVALARADSIRHPYVQADVEFMYNMVGHHAQAITMSRWAPSHGASPAVQRLASRIINAQHDEIATMQTWLRDRRKPVPVPSEHGEPMQMMMGGELMEHMLMPGMLTDAQMQALDAARGDEFDRLFLVDMMQHHRGAVSMVKDLFASYGAAQDEVVFKFANDVNVDQTTEIARMEKMLVALMVGGEP
jgi:uncharacterized protein (DUF305 family)